MSGEYQSIWDEQLKQRALIEIIRMFGPEKPIETEIFGCNMCGWSSNKSLKRAQSDFNKHNNSHHNGQARLMVD